MSRGTGQRCLLQRRRHLAPAVISPELELALAIPRRCKKLFVKPSRAPGDRRVSPVACTRGGLPPLQGKLNLFAPVALVQDTCQHEARRVSRETTSKHPGMCSLMQDAVHQPRGWEDEACAPRSSPPGSSLPALPQKHSLAPKTLWHRGKGAAALVKRYSDVGSPLRSPRKQDSPSRGTAAVSVLQQCQS